MEGTTKAKSSKSPSKDPIRKIVSSAKGGKQDPSRSTFRVGSKETRERKELESDAFLLTPKREVKETNHTITNLFLLELFDLSGEETVEFRQCILENLGELDRIKDEQLMGRHDSMLSSMHELRRTSNKILKLKSNEDYNTFLAKPANLNVLGYFPRTFPAPPAQILYSRSADIIPRKFAEFTVDRGAARVSAYNWRAKEWKASIQRNLEMKERIEKAKKELDPSIVVKRVVMKRPNQESSETVKVIAPVSKRASSILLSTQESPPEVPSTSIIPKPIDMMNERERIELAKKIELARAGTPVDKDRDEVNFYRAVSANKVNPAIFGTPKGFVKYGKVLVHTTKSWKIEREIERACEKKRKDLKLKEEFNEKMVKRDEEMEEKMKKRKEELKGRKRMKKDDFEEKTVRPKPNLKDSMETAQKRGTGDATVVMDDIEDEDEEDRGMSPPPAEDTVETSLEEEIDVGVPPVYGMKDDVSTQTEDGERLIRTEKGEVVVEREVAEKIERLEQIHKDDGEIIKKLRAEKSEAYKNASKAHEKAVSLVMDRNQTRMEMEMHKRMNARLKQSMAQMQRQWRDVREQNELMIHEIASLKNELALREMEVEPNDRFQY